MQQDSGSMNKRRQQLTSRAFMNSRQPKEFTPPHERRTLEVASSEEILSDALPEDFSDAVSNTFSDRALEAASKCTEHIESSSQSVNFTTLNQTSRCAQQVEKHQLCQDCQRIDFAAILKISATTLQENPRSGIFIATLGYRLSSAAKISCPLCRLFFQMRILGPRLNERHEYHLRAYTAFNPFNSMSLHGCPERLASKDLPCLAVVSSSFTNAAIPDSNIKFLYCHSSQYDQKRIFKAVPIGTSVDFSRIRKIMAYCRSKHRNLCHNFQPTVSGMKLINCKKPAETISALDIQLISSTCPPYIALSYVWGNSNNGSNSSNVDNNTPVPRVVSDAMIAARELGYDFLWVDKLCIDQSNHSEKNYQMSRMDEIYEGAGVTLVAATGENASSGLAGVEHTPRIPQQSLSLGNIQLISSMQMPRETIESSTWFTRSWTYQEGVLPYRRFVFTPHEIYFECESMHWRESWEANLDDLHSHGRFRKFLSPGIFTGRDSSGGTTSRSSFRSLKRYDRLLSNYSTKKFSHNFGETDSLRAFQGIINDFEKSKYPVFQLWGMPFTWSDELPQEASRSFVASLLWRHKNSTFSEETKPKRRSAFPSWSCSGWEGEVVMFTRFQSQSKDFVSKAVKFALESDDGSDVVELSSPDLLSKLRQPQVAEFRVIRFKAYRLLRTQLRFRIRRTNESWETPNFRLGDSDMTASIHMSGGAVTTRSFAYLLMSGKFDFVLLTTGTRVLGERRSYHLTFLVVERRGAFSYRVGIMVVKSDLETFEKHFTLRKREVIRLQ